ncbi:MFS transporter [Halomonas elongata]|uniref:MFS transporter n=1 Tax=Halomonas elongata (strain ATCC 33173 / DSM 2581 / NBRC 15536 / NCIMB 2198 / 1H9) TaxID=768066 RepID=E1V5Q9_HALED|nr:MFS transporter [Halomonas elongata]MBW5801240.1 MFS transporter [Halomonas elongata]RAW06025.1 MFS transporter [Halomonas elongata]WBF18408.1 MFS transporter [Halomonas elongata]WPU47260.1 MFS transporter [Halomonas elongata DSM 2581]CBV41171.1 major facilitator superfamily transport protein [Halomonas elongata DSM 2581]
MPIALFALTLSAFAIGTTEFVIVGLVPTIAQDLGVSLPSAGLLVSLYAVGVAIGAPVLTALTGRFNRKWVLLGLMALFIAGNLLAWRAPGYESLIVARVLTGLAHGVFFSIGSTIATGLVGKDKEARAIAIMFTGLTVALVTGVPLGTWIGQHLGWRATFLAVSGLGLLALLGSALLVPGNLERAAPAGITRQFRVLAQPRLLLVYAITILGYGGTFTAFTFLAPILENISGFGSGAVSLIMLVYGASVAVGNLYGGMLADRLGAIRALTWIFGGLASLLLIFSVTAGHPIAAVLTILVWGAFAFGNVPGLQVYVVQLAERHVPESVDVASGLNIAAFNIGIALGSVIGGRVVDAMSLTDTAWIGALIVVLALIATRWSGALDARRSSPLDGPEHPPHMGNSAQTHHESSNLLSD